MRLSETYALISQFTRAVNFMGLSMKSTYEFTVKYLMEHLMNYEIGNYEIGPSNDSYSK